MPASYLLLLGKVVTGISPHSFGNSISGTIPRGIWSLAILWFSRKREFRWPLGRVQEVFPGTDGLVRTAAVKTERGVYERPVVKMAPLFIYEDT